ncbi:MAG: holB [Gemmatimonadetes bacterium]|nr:holB [Gemmatimonadota bacterium]
MPLLPLYGHTVLRTRFDDAIRRDALPGSLLLHGPLGVGKQRLALWLGQRLLCSGSDPKPCGTCQHCRYALAGTHPDLHWFFPRPRPKDSDASPAKIADDFREAIGERTKTGVYAPPAPEEGIYISTVRAMVQSASMAPAIAERKVYVLGDAERMVLREGAEEAAGPFLKLLEEPSAKTTLILTTSEPGALIPTIRSRLLAVRVAPLGSADVDAVLAEPAMQAAIAEAGGPKKLDEQRRVANGAPGALVAGGEWADAIARARRMLDAASNGDRREQARTALLQGSAKARGAFSTSLDALTTLLHESIRASTERGNERGATAAAKALDVVEAAKFRATGNVNPQLITSELLRQLERLIA